VIIDGGAGNDTLTGGRANDHLNGGVGNDSLNGAAGADRLIGGDGSDFYFVDNAGDVVSETNAVASTGGIDTVYSYIGAYTLTDNVENLLLQSAGAANGTGNNLNNVIDAAAGNNILNGGAGIDTASYAFATAAVTANLGLTTAQATGGSGSDTLLNFENLTGSNYHDKLTGNALANTLSGGLGNDQLNGAAGADRLIGGDGSDFYFVDNAGDVVSETNAVASTGGIDTVYSYIGAYTLTDNVENLLLLATGAANGTGNSLNNVIDAAAGNNILNGAAGIDTVSYAFATAAVTANLGLTTAQATGGSGSDTLLNFENLTGSNFHDKLTGNALANTLNGGAGNDTLAGGAGNDLLIGGTGLDMLYGGTGADTFDFNALNEMGLGAALRDVIGDFKTSEGDKIDLSTLDANLATAANDAFSFIGASAFSSNATGQLRFAGGVLYGSTDADTAAEFEIQLVGVSNLQTADLFA
jgi:Ca2+-binding RTX toxin-like protein